MATKSPIVNSSGTLTEISLSDTINAANLGTGTPNSSSVLRGDSTWGAPSLVTSGSLSGLSSLTIAVGSIGQPVQSNSTNIDTAFTINVPTGTPTDGQKLLIRLKDAGTAKGITWNAIFTVVGVILPTTTVASKTHYIGCVYNGSSSVWDVVAVGVQA